MQQFRNTVAKIHLNRLEKNFHEFKKILGPDAFLCPMVKANAYGHGDIQCAQRLEKTGSKYLGVGLLEEGIRLREHGIKIPILYFGTFDVDGAKALFEYEITPVMSTWEQWQALESLKEKIKIHIKFNTGMNRLGFSIDDVEKIKKNLALNRSLSLVGLCTHLHTADNAFEPESSTEKQLDIFAQIAQELANYNPTLHALNTDGLVSLGKKYNQKNSFVNNYGPLGGRPGIGLYGYHSSFLSGPDLRPVMTLESEIIKITRVKKGETVSYGGKWKALEDSLIAVIPIGYADGYHRLLSNNSLVLVNGQRVPVVGTVCMDYIMIDVSGLENAVKVQQSVMLFGSEDEGALTADELASRAQSISYEILTSVGPRVPRKYIE